jgi:glucosamine--fructose-6-phosphate aminotransferase (isomerizing)
VLFLGRGVSFPIALEGALKLKEISYIHAEGYAAGEMKHGPIALIDEDMPVVVLVPRDDALREDALNLQEVKAREAHGHRDRHAGDADVGDDRRPPLLPPEVDPQLTPFVTCCRCSCYAYYVADFKGTDVDQPRNLAKTVTVE